MKFHIVRQKLINLKSISLLSCKVYNINLNEDFTYLKNMNI